MDKELSQIILSAWADSTISTRKSQWKRYATFCGDHWLVALPANEVTVARFFTFLARSCKFTTVNNYLSSIIVLHKYYGHPAEFRNTFYIQLVIRGLKRVLGDQVTQSIPLTPEQLLSCFKLTSSGGGLEDTCWAAVVLCFRTLLRKSNVLPDSSDLSKSPHVIRRKDVKFYGWGMVITVYSSKTIQYRERSLEIPVFCVPGSPLCAVERLRLHFALYPGSVESPLFLKGSRELGFSPLLYKDVLSQLKKWTSSLGLDTGRVGLHSLRRSGATYLCRLGVPLSDIKCMGDWRSLAVLEYLITPMSRKLQIESMTSHALGKIIIV